MAVKTRRNKSNRNEFKSKSPIYNPDEQSIPENPFILRPENTPKHLHHLISEFDFRRCILEEILNSENLTQDAWQGMIPTNTHDLIARNLINAPMCGVFTKDGKMIAYTRQLWGYDNFGNPEIHSHMTAVSSDYQDRGIGEALKWQTRQIALEFPKPAITQLSATFDNQQGRIAHVNLNKLGMACGAAGGRFRQNIYGELQGEQHKGNPTDRYHARWYLDSDWVQAHLYEKINIFSLEEAKRLPLIIKFEHTDLFYQNNQSIFPIPKQVDTNLNKPYIVLPCPLNWDEFLKLDSQYNNEHINQWRHAHRVVLNYYFANAYTTILQISDKNEGVNLQVLAKDFDPYHPPLELLIV